jgi:hypothetical protein
MVDRAGILRIAAQLGISLDAEYHPQPKRPAPSPDEDPILDLSHPHVNGRTLDQVLENFGMPLFSVKVICASGASCYPWVYPPFCQTADEVAAHFGVSRRTIQEWKARKTPWKPDQYYSIPQIEYWRRLEFDEPMGPAYFAVAIVKAVRGELCALLKEPGPLDPAKILAALPTDADVAQALWNTREE